MPIDINGNVEDITIDGQNVQEVTIDGQLAWKRETIIDDFERASLSHYRISTGAFDIIPNRSSHGSRSLRALGGDGNKVILSRPGDGLNAYPSRGDTIRFDIQFNSTNGLLLFGFFHGPGAAEEDGYELEFDARNNQLTLYDDRGSENRFQLGSDSTGYAADTWNQCTINTHGGGIDVSYRGANISVNDTSRNNGGVLFFTDGVRGFWDYLRYE